MSSSITNCKRNTEIPHLVTRDKKASRTLYQIKSHKLLEQIEKGNKRIDFSSTIDSWDARKRFQPRSGVQRRYFPAKNTVTTARK